MSQVSGSSLLGPERVYLREDDDLQVRRESINQFIRENYRLCVSNVDHLDEAQIICLGETHGLREHQMSNGEIINRLCEEDGQSILLVEKSSPESSEELMPQCEQASYVTKPIKIEGWDIKFDANSKNELMKFVVAGMIYENPRAVNFVSVSKTDKYFDDLNNDEVSVCSKITTLFSFCCMWYCAALFVKSCTPCIKRHYKKVTERGFQHILSEVPARNQKMCDRIEEVSRNHKKVFVIAGFRHFEVIEKGCEAIDYEAYSRAVEQTLEFISTKKFAILIPNYVDD